MRHEFVSSSHPMPNAAAACTRHATQVFLARWHDTPVAVKVILVEGAAHDAEVARVEKEAAKLRQLQFEHVVRYYGACYDKRQVCVCMVLHSHACECGALLCCAQHKLAWTSVARVAHMNAICAPALMLRPCSQPIFLTLMRANITRTRCAS